MNKIITSLPHLITEEHNSVEHFFLTLKISVFCLLYYHPSFTNRLPDVPYLICWSLLFLSVTSVCLCVCVLYASACTFFCEGVNVCAYSGREQRRTPGVFLNPLYIVSSRQSHLMNLKLYAF